MGAEDPAEAALGNYLVNGLRPRIRRGEASEAILAQARTILGIMNFTRRTRSDPAEMMQVLLDYVHEHGRMPKDTASQPAETQKLAKWASNQVKGILEAKQGTARERHEMILRLRQTHPAGARAARR
ncbi:hypothetical protein [Arthrobacter mobilis]|uniref:Uncharacterized protein n=1 Tax=Arthrobacter mobilis TaxID=2724944 RepID=A0A7X6HF26_9MICC|nr:hypothetical protein [Arthrobacter mobilis]NKX55992.1 hypothetical protein [Arthrobacter mobilis]